MDGRPAPAASPSLLRKHFGISSLPVWAQMLLAIGPGFIHTCLQGVITISFQGLGAATMGIADGNDMQLLIAPSEQCWHRGSRHRLAPVLEDGAHGMRTEARSSTALRIEDLKHLLLALPGSPEMEENQIRPFRVPLPTISTPKALAEEAPLGSFWCQAPRGQKGMPWSIWILIGGVATLVVEEPSVVPMVVAQILVPALVIQQVGILPQPARISHQDGCSHGVATGHNYLGFAEVIPDSMAGFPMMSIDFPIAIHLSQQSLVTDIVA